MDVDLWGRYVEARRQLACDLASEIRLLEECKVAEAAVAASRSRERAGRVALVTGELDCIAGSDEARDGERAAELRGELAALAAQAETELTEAAARAAERSARVRRIRAGLASIEEAHVQLLGPQQAVVRAAAAEPDMWALRDGEISDTLEIVHEHLALYASE